ncbi:MAG: hypothetical protein GW795_09340 [Cyanobacteria bacterium]|nr:hypothetical protein [Cyanobacteria bacterium CG_2015-04_32_10]
MNVWVERVVEKDKRQEIKGNGELGISNVPLCPLPFALCPFNFALP